MPPSSFESANDSGRIPDGDDICGKITNHNRAGTDHRVLTDRDAGQTITPPPSQTLSMITMGSAASDVSRRRAGLFPWMG